MDSSATDLDDADVKHLAEAQAPAAGSLIVTAGSEEPPRAKAVGPTAASASIAAAAAAAAAAAPDPEDRRVPGRAFITAAMLLVMVLVSMEQTITSTAMPSIIGELHGLEHYSWVASIYLLACTVTMPLYGRLADAFGRKRVVLAAIALFCVASLLASTARSMTQLIVFRGLQGLGAGGVMPVVLTILGDIFTLRERARIQGFFSAVWGTSALAGPALGALLVKTLGWRSVFWVNLPIGLLGLLVLALKYHERRDEHEMDLDLPGVASLGIASIALLSLVSRLGPGGWSWPMIALLVAATVASVAYFARHERGAAHPILPTELFTRRDVGPAILGSCLFGIGFLSLDTFVPLYVQGGRGGDATAAAGVVTPVMLTWALSGTVAAPLLVRWGFRRTAALGGMLIVAGFGGLVACALLAAPHWAITATLAVTGLGFGPASMSFLISAQEAATYSQRGMVTSAISFFRTMGGAVGIGILGAMFNVVTAAQSTRLTDLGVRPAELLDPHAQSRIAPNLLRDAQHMIASGLTWVFVAMLTAAVLLLAVTRLMPKGKTAPRAAAPEQLDAVGA
ncbi:MAG TPA: MDR family MFS transporter [Tepidisphaeraceae bacterium]|nr:MDR family MFS transporter [Tepidisphaeraceae bacterium]